MDMIFWFGKENTAAQYEYWARILTKPGRKRHPSHMRDMRLILNIILQSFELALLHSGQRLAKLTVFTPRRSTLLARSQNTGAQTIQFKQDTLELRLHIEITKLLIEFLVTLSPSYK